MHVRPGSVREATRAAVASICDVLARSDALVVGATVYRASRRNALGPPVALSASRVYPADTARLRIRAGRIEEGTIPDLGVIMRGGFQHGAGMGGPPPPPGEFLLVVVDRQSGTWVGEFITDGLAVLEAVLSEH
jgi:hypothetical protein